MNYEALTDDSLAAIRRCTTACVELGTFDPAVDLEVDALVVIAG